MSCPTLDKYENNGIAIGDIKATVTESQYYHASYDDTIRRVAEKFNLSEDDAEEQVKLYWE
ncbi:hypothetical protein [Butyrivibrio sp. INlla16]|uniref:hypothetical protein n=1 Tax=Butyrivibrio sp. INlla16 TaxID=1520807 RepID=UPI00088760F8|nr:hypothetical protein [Butyrivibrio sp. INlla16]SDB52237.1 hypothetical protein SAMN02910263_02642 [Butyrivibrio sp. INlla16]